jgi:hypothetical protein
LVLELDNSIRRIGIEKFVKNLEEATKFLEISCNHWETYFSFFRVGKLIAPSWISGAF